MDDLKHQNGEYVYQKAIDVYGEEAQINLTVEESSELTAELARQTRSNRENDEKINEEIADLEIMLEQMAYLLPEDIKEINTPTAVTTISDAKAVLGEIIRYFAQEYVDKTVLVNGFEAVSFLREEYDRDAIDRYKQEKIRRLWKRMEEN